jgi:Toprim-like
MSRDLIFSLPSAKRRESLASSTATYAASVDLALPYLTNRGIDRATAVGWQLGYVEQPAPGHERFTGWLAIPYVTPAGVVCQKFRCIQPHRCSDLPDHRKYDAEQGSGTFLFGVTALKSDSAYVCVTEGELDCIIANDVALLPAVGVSGSTKWRAHWNYIFEGYSDVVVLKDGDTAGDALARNVTNNVQHSRVVAMPDGHDVNSFVLEFGGQALRERAGL